MRYSFKLYTETKLKNRTSQSQCEPIPCSPLRGLFFFESSTLGDTISIAWPLFIQSIIFFFSKLLSFFF